MSIITHSSQKIFCDTSSPIAQKISNVKYIFPLSLPIILHHEDEHVIAIGIESLSLPLSFYTINSFNDTFSINDVIYKIPNGNYRVTQLRASLQVLLSSLDVKINLDTITSKFNITSDTLLTLTFDATDNSAINLLGYTIGQHSLPYFFEEVINLTYTTGVTVRCGNINTTNIDTYKEGDGGSVLLRVPITTSPNSIMQYFNPFPFYNTLANRTLTQLEIGLYDDDRQLINLNGSHQWNIVLRVDYVKKATYIQDKTKMNKMRLQEHETVLPEPPRKSKKNKIKKK